MYTLPPLGVPPPPPVFVLAYQLIESLDIFIWGFLSTISNIPAWHCISSFDILLIIDDSKIEPLMS